MIIESIDIKALKSFVDVKLKLGNLTVLSGLNGSGKSTLIQALRMLISAFDNKTPYLKGFGNYDDLKSKNALRSHNIFIAVETSTSRHELTIGRDAYRISDEKLNLKFEYICAARLGPTASLPVMDSGETKLSVGMTGEYLVDYYSFFNDISINPTLLHHSSDSTTLEIQLNSWMSEISPGVKLHFTKVHMQDMSHIEVDTFRSTNTGFGISYSLPIVMALLVLSSSEGVETLTNPIARDWIKNNVDVEPLLLIENPEAHLHPRGQTALGELVAKAANSGIQIIVETHSDHFIDGIRIAVKESLIDASKIKLKFFEKEKDGSTTIKDINLLSDGSIEEWPEGYFDQMYKNLSRLTS